MYEVLHDVYLDVLGVSIDEKAANELLKEVPMDIKHLANQWGWHDTEVGDKLFRWLKNRNS